MYIRYRVRGFAHEKDVRSCNCKPPQNITQFDEKKIKSLKKSKVFQKQAQR